MFTNIKWDNFGQRVEVFSGGKVKLVKSEKSVTFFGVEGNKALSSFQYEYL